MDDISRDRDTEALPPRTRGAKGPSEVLADEASVIDEVVLARSESVVTSTRRTEPLRIERLEPDTAPVRRVDPEPEKPEPPQDPESAVEVEPELQDEPSRDELLPGGEAPEAEVAAPADEAEVAPTTARADDACEDEDEAPALSDPAEIARVSLALLLAHREGVSVMRLAEVLGATQKLVRQGLDALDAILEEGGLPIEISRSGDRIKALTRPVVYPYLKRLKGIKRAAQLSPAALETLAVIAYRQPVIRAEIESIRGVKAGPMLRTLLEGKLVKVTGRADVPGRPLQYGTTQHFLERFGLSSLKELPSIQEFKSLG